jgi:hypothetical protein
MAQIHRQASPRNPQVPATEPSRRRSAACRRPKSDGEGQVRSDLGHALPSFVLADGEHVISRSALRELLEKLEEFTEHRAR